MNGFRTFKVFRSTSNEQVQKLTESQIIYARSPEAASRFAKKWALELVEYGSEEIVTLRPEASPQFPQI